MRLLVRLTFLMLAAAGMVSASAAEEPAVEVVVENLANPCAVALQPETGHIFISDSGAGRIVRLVDGELQEVVTGFGLDTYGSGPKYQIGPLGLAFLDAQTLLVGGGGKPDGEDQLAVYAVPEPGAMPLKADQAFSTATLAADGNTPGEGNFYAVAAAPAGLFVTCNGDDAKGWIARAVVRDNKIDVFERYLATKDAVHVDAPVALTVSRRGELVVGQMGEVDVPSDSLLSFYNPRTEKLLLNLETGLSDITALAYGPKGQLLATDFSWHDPSQGGLFQMVAAVQDGRQVVEGRKIVSLDKPTAVAFDADGALYVTVIGSAADGDEKPSGKLLRISGGQW